MKREEQKEDLNVVELLEKMDIEIRGIRRELNELRQALPVSETMTVSDIAKKLGVSTSTLYQRPWRLPNFGRATIDGTPRRWKRDEVFAWYERLDDERRTEWESMSQSEKARYR